MVVRATTAEIARRDAMTGMVGAGLRPTTVWIVCPSEEGEWQGVPIRPDPAGVPRCKPSSTQPLDGLGLSIRVVVTAMSQKRIIHTNKIRSKQINKVPSVINVVAKCPHHDASS